MRYVKYQDALSQMQYMCWLLGLAVPSCFRGKPMFEKAVPLAVLVYSEDECKR